MSSDNVNDVMEEIEEGEIPSGGAQDHGDQGSEGGDAPIVDQGQSADSGSGEGAISPEDHDQEDHGEEEGDGNFHLWDYKIPEGPITLEKLDTLVEAIKADPYDWEVLDSLLREAKDRFILGIAEGHYSPEMTLVLSLKFKSTGICTSK